MITEFTLRDILPGDLASVFSIEDRSFKHGWTAPMLEEELNRDDAVFLLAEHKGEAAGYILLRTGLGEAELFRIAVLPGFRRCGLGTILLDEAVRRVKLKGAERILLEVREDNLQALALYRTFGFLEIGVRKKYYDGSVNALLMELKI